MTVIEVLKNKNLEALEVAINNEIEFIQELLDNGMRIDEYFEGFTLLIGASLLEKFDIVQFLIENGADVNIANPNNITPLLFALRENYMDIAEILVENGAGSLPDLSIASIDGRYDIVNYFVENDIVDIRGTGYILEEIYSDIDTNMYEAVEYDGLSGQSETIFKQLAIAEILIENGANINLLLPHKKSNLLSAIDASKKECIYSVQSAFLGEVEYGEKMRELLGLDEGSNNPQMLVKLLRNFTIDTPIKYSTHLWDFGSLQKEYGDFKGFLNSIQKQWEGIEVELKLLSPNLHEKIYNFLLNKESSVSWCSRGDINIGWSSLEGLEVWCNDGNNPFEFILHKEYEVEGKTITTFGEVILLFKREIEIRNENNMLEGIFLVEKQKLGRKFHVELINLKGKSFYMDVEKFRNVVERIFNEMKKRQEYPDIEIKFSKEENDFMEIKIIQVGSKAGRNAKEMIDEVNDGDWKILNESLTNLCDWSIESSYEEQGYRLNYLRRPSVKEIEVLNEIPKGFTHILRFYK